MAWPEACLYPVSDAVGDVEAALIEPLAVALHTLDLGRLHPGQTVAVIGCGPIGVLLVALARRAGADLVIATDPLRHRLEMARAFRATATIEASPSGYEAGAVSDATGGRGCDLVFEVAGENPAVESAIEAARAGSRVVLVGIPSDRTTFSASVARRKGLTLTLAQRSTQGTFRCAVQLAESGQIDLGRLVSRRAPAEEAIPAVAGFVAHEGTKIIIEPQAAPSTGGR